MNPPKINLNDIETHLAILGERGYYCVVNKNYETGKVSRPEWLEKESISAYVKITNLRKKSQVWISLNDKELNNDSIKGVLALSVLEFDLDVERKEGTLATNDQIKEIFSDARKIIGYLEEKFGAIAFLAMSGNGWKVVYPLPRHSLPSVESRMDMNDKLRGFCKKVAKECDVKIDSTYDLRRLTGVIGSHNLKIPNKPRWTSWYNPDGKVFDVEGTRKKNRKLLDAIVYFANFEEEPRPPEELEKLQTKSHKLLSDFIEKDEKLRILCKEDFEIIQKKYGYPTRSEAEFALLCTLVYRGFSDIEIYNIMGTALINSWHERSNVAKSKQIKRAREFIAGPSKNENATHINQKVWKIATNPHLLDYICKDITRTVKKDVPSKISSFITALSMYTKDPINLSQKGPTSVGKGYNANESTKYFPEKDVWPLLGLSRKAIVHLPGILKDEKDQQIQLEERPRKPMRGDFPRGDDGRGEYRQALETYKGEKTSWDIRITNSYVFISLWNVTLLFQESPEEDVLRLLYPILSHDRKRAEYKFTDPKTLITKKIVLEGWPAAIFLDVGKHYMEEFSTRTLTLSPESSSEKITEANILTNVRMSYPWNFEGDTEEFKLIKALILSLKHQLTELEVKVVIPFELHESFPKERVRDMRDFKQFGRFLKTVTLLHVFQRPILKRGKSLYVVSSVDDVILSLAIYSRIFETTRTGAEERILDFYHNIVKTEPEWTKKELVRRYNETAKRKLSGDTIGKWCDRLYELQYLNKERCHADKRINAYTPIIFKDEKLEFGGLLENPNELRIKLEDSFKEWEKNVGKENEFYKYKFLNNKLILESISPDVAQQIIKKDSIGKEDRKIPSILKQLTKVKVERQPVKERKPEKPTISSDSVPKFCHLCGDDLYDGRQLSNFDGRYVHVECGELELKMLKDAELKENQESDYPKGITDNEDKRVYKNLKEGMKEKSQTTL